MRSRTYIAVPPGATIKEQLKDRGMNQKEFALRMDMSEKHISRLINGDVQLTPETALRLEMVLGVPAHFWNNLETSYRDTLIRVQAENEMDADLRTAEKFPWRELVGLGWIEEAETPEKMVTSLRKYFGVVRLSLLEEPGFGFAGPDISDSETINPAAMAWLRQAGIRARQSRVPRLNIEKLEKALGSISMLCRKKAGRALPRLTECLAGCGVVLVILPPVDGMNLSGASFVSEKKTIICIDEKETGTERFGNLLFRQLAHIILGHTGGNRKMTIEDKNSTDSWIKAHFS